MHKKLKLRFLDDLLNFQANYMIKAMEETSNKFISVVEERSYQSEIYKITKNSYICILLLEKPNEQHLHYIP